MTEREIRKYIDRLNNANAGESIFTRQIHKYVDVAKVWSEQPKITDKIIGNSGSYRFFFLKNGSKEYVGAVLDMYSDLHWYIVPKHRKKGYLTTALREAILPYIFYGDREVQRLTIEYGTIGDKNYSDSKGVAIKLGFKAINEVETEFELNKTEFNWNNENLNEIDLDINPDRFEELRRRVFFAYKTLYKISDELLMSVDDDKELKEVADEVRKYTWKLEDLEWEKRKAKKV